MNPKFCNVTNVKHNDKNTFTLFYVFDELPVDIHNEL